MWKATSVAKIESEKYRSHLAPLMGRGSISTIRMFPNNRFTQSNTDMLNGELDADLAGRRAVQPSAYRPLL